MKLENLKSESDSIGAVALALSKAQLEIKQPKKSKHVKMVLRDNKGTKEYDYADLNDVIESFREILAKNELVLVQRIITVQEDVVEYFNDREQKFLHAEYLITTLAHSSGEFFQTWVRLRNRKSGIQEFGTELTYLRRYSASSLIGIASEDDDDGVGSGEGQGADTGKGGKKKDPTPPAKTEPPAGKSPSGNPPPTNLQVEDKTVLAHLEKEIKAAIKEAYPLEALAEIEKNFKVKEQVFRKIGVFDKGMDRIKITRNQLEGTPDEIPQ